MAKSKKSTKGEHFKVKDVEAALRESRGFRSHAAKLLGVAPTTITNYIKRHPSLQKVLDDARLEMDDVAEHALFTLISPPVENPPLFLEDGSPAPQLFYANGKAVKPKPIRPPCMPSTIFYNKTRNRDRGYQEHVQQDTKADVTYHIAPPEDFPDEDYDDPELKNGHTHAPPEGNGSGS